jgi:hypothetical protein
MHYMKDQLFWYGEAMLLLPDSGVLEVAASIAVDEARE